MRNPSLLRPTSGSVFEYEIDAALHLRPANTLRGFKRSDHWFEEAIDTVIMLNIGRLGKDLFGATGHYLFTNLIYWGTFDVAWIGDDGRVIACENKKSRPKKKDFLKFYRDATKLRATDQLIAHLQERIDHVCTYGDDYMRYAHRSFAGYFLDVRAYTAEKNRDLPGEAADLLGLSGKEFEKLFLSGMEWLQTIRPTLEEHLSDLGVGPIRYDQSQERFLPVLMASDTDPAHIEYRLTYPELKQCPGLNFAVYNYEFLSRPGQQYPQGLQIRHIGNYTF